MGTRTESGLDAAPSRPSQPHHGSCRCWHTAGDEPHGRWSRPERGVTARASPVHHEDALCPPSGCIWREVQRATPLVPDGPCLAEEPVPGCRLARPPGDESAPWDWALGGGQLVQ